MVTPAPVPAPASAPAPVLLASTQSNTTFVQLPTAEPLPQPGNLLIGLAGLGGMPTGISISGSGLPQMLMPGVRLTAAAPAPLQLFTSSGAGSAVAALPLVVSLQAAPGGTLASVQRTDQPNFNLADLKDLTEPNRTTPLQVTLLDGTQLTINVGMSGQALVLQLPPELSRQDALRSGVLAALAKSLAELGVGMNEVKSIVLLQKPRQLAAR